MTEKESNIRAVYNGDLSDFTFETLAFPDGTSGRVLLECGDEPGEMFFRIVGTRGLENDIEDHVREGNIPLPQYVRTVEQALGEPVDWDFDGANSTGFKAIYDLDVQ